MSQINPGDGTYQCECGQFFQASSVLIVENKERKKNLSNANADITAL